MARVTTIRELLEERLEANGDNQSAEVRTLKKILASQGGHVGVSRETYLKWLSGHSIPGDQYIPALAEYLQREQWDVSIRLIWQRADEKGVSIDIGELSHAPVAQFAQPVPALRLVS